MADRITVSLGLTKNLGNFNSLRVDAGIESDVREGETTEDAYARLWALVDSQIAEQLESAEE